MARHPSQPTYKDPVCGMEISRNTAPSETEYEGKTYYFCAPVCRDQFLEDPAKYVPAEHSEGG